MTLFDAEIDGLYLLLPIILYAEIHYRIWHLFSRYFKREPEIVADVPHRKRVGSQLPVFICVKDADKYPITLNKIKIEAINHNRILVAEKKYHLAISDSWWYDLFLCELKGLKGTVEIDVTISYLCRGKEKICVNDNYKLTSHKPFVVFCDEHPRPGLAGWVVGDMHTHSHLTNDHVEFGAPFEVSAAMAKAMELDFFASTDHSYDLDDCLDNYLRNDPTLPKWRLLWEQVEKLNKKHKDFVIVQGEELSVGNARCQNVHHLIFNNKQFFEGRGDSAEKWLDTKPQHTIKNIIALLEKEALSFAAHPVCQPPLLQKLLINRGIWLDDDLATPGLFGAQFWNGDKHHFLTIGLPKWIELLLNGHKIILIAGTDAHGNFNRFRQIGIPHLSMREEQRELFGTSLTGVYIEGKLSLNSLIEGLRRGRVIVTDGPVAAFRFRPLTPGDERKTALRIGDSTTTTEGIIYMDVCSSPSFGEIKKIHLYIGNITAKKETRRCLETPSGSFKVSQQELLRNCPRPGYVRLEVETGIDDQSFICLTNPLYID
ncbi:hypothetical protein EH223_18590 [candidate division KSB1 bacterium]|nr:hypothetical protein [candidate division KSB1 bacterium]RQW00399.1 MAG: hypothetical protein EH223_18590 [candidate division KSB1 bacterium]